ncbi:MAG: UvrD-helicase domain-containing protein, partial [Phycisphaerae bacterium]|nr:UvrD-helicase domain-containing protein [Phycisphaerae bacterium]
AIAEAGLDSQNFAPAAVHARISAAKNQLLTAELFAEQAQDFMGRQLAKAYLAYERLLKRMNGLDFDDLLLRTALALETNDALRRDAAARYRYLLIDEYQDTNRAQFVIARMIAGEHRNICVVGDPDQSIYRWRGADIRNILEFEDAFPGASTVALGENFRSTGHIVAAADALIRDNKRRKQKPLYTAEGPGVPVRVVRCAHEHAEAELVAETVQEAGAEGVPWREMAVLYRMNALSRVVEDSFRRRSIPYRIVRGTAFYERKEVKDLLAYLRVTLNPSDDVACARIVNVPPRAIGDTSVEKIERVASARGLSLLSALPHAREAGVADRTVKRIDQFAAMVQRWRGMLLNAGPDALAAFVDTVLSESGLREWSDGAAGDDVEERRANLDEVVSAAGEFALEPAPPDVGDARGATDAAGSAEPLLRDALAAYLQSVALVADTDALDPTAGAVTLMTMHAAKGLEYTQVCIVGCEEGLLPHSRSANDDEELEEERRLLFVGITRAKRRLLLAHAACRTVRGMRMSTMESSFLRELPEADVHRQDFTYRADGSDAFDGVDEPGGDADGDDRGGGAPHRGSADQGIGARFPAGTVVRHPMFGTGTVQSVMPRGSVTSVRVAFRSVGVKTLVLEYARLERLS